MFMAVKEKKLCINLYIEKSFIKRLETIVNDPNNIFDSQSALIRYCLKQMLPSVENDLKTEAQQKK